jgi:serine/threonine protein kinase
MLLALSPLLCHCVLQRTPQETLYKIKTQEVSYPAELSEGATAFIKAALVRDPDRRASLTDLLQHPWLLRHLRSNAGPPHMRGRTQTQVGAVSLQYRARFKPHQHMLSK